MEPEYIEAAKKLVDLDSDIKLGKVDATEQSELAEENKIRGYPTLKFYRDGKASDYNGLFDLLHVGCRNLTWLATIINTGGRSANEIVNWLLKKTGPAAKAINSVADAKEFAASGNVVVLGLFQDLESEAAKQFMAAAQEVDDFKFAISADADVRKEYEVAVDAVLVLKKVSNQHV